MPAWFDIMSLAWHVNPNGPEDEEGLEKSKAIIDNLIETEIKEGINSSRIILWGVSQGGALALYTSLTTQHKLGGVIISASWLPLRNKFPASVVNTNAETPFFQVHGDSDKVVPYKLGQLTSTILKGFLTNHEFKTYKGLAHTVSAKEMQDVKNFLHSLISEGKTKYVVNEFF